MVKKCEVVSGAGNKVTFKSYADDDPDMSIQVEHFTRVLDEEAVIQIYNFMKEHYERTIASKLSNWIISIKDRLMPDFGREKVCYVPYLGLPDDMVDSSYMAFRELMGRVEPQITISQSKYTELQDKADAFEVMKKERDDYKFKYETWKEDFEDLSEMYNNLVDRHEALEEDLNAKNRVLESWKAMSNAWRDSTAEKEEELYLEQDKVKMLLNFLKREGYEPEFMYNGTVLKVKRN